MDEFRFSIQEEMDGERIDKCISILIDTLSRSYIQKLIKKEQILANGVPVRANYRVKAEDDIVFYLPKAVEPDILPEDIPLDILYEDEDLLFINKPKGMVVHPAAGHYNGTLVNAVLYHCSGQLSGINGVMRPGIVHRIDKDTTGSLVICKNDMAHSSVAAQLKAHTINRKYRAVVRGILKEEEGTVNSPIARHPVERKKMAAGMRGGKEAVTHYKVLERFTGQTYIECRLETGRTHQIRVHMASIGHPLLGDQLYGGADKNLSCLEGQTLHAMTLGLIHPRTSEYLEVEAPLPSYFVELLEKLR